jgi:hypothetical protein
MSKFEVIPVHPAQGGLIGGHYAVKHNVTQRIIGRSFHLDRTQADVLKFELEHMYELAKKEAANDPT